MKVFLVSDVLDEQVADVNGENAGRVDGIVLTLRDDGPPRVTCIEVSPITLLARFSERLAEWYARRDRRFGHGRGVAFRIPWGRLHRQERAIRIEADADATPINALDHWLRVKIVERIPGG